MGWPLGGVVAGLGAIAFVRVLTRCVNAMSDRCVIPPKPDAASGYMPGVSMPSQHGYWLNFDSAL